MIPKLSRLVSAACVVAVTTTALAGPDPVDTASQVHQPPVVKWHKKIVNAVLVACGVVEPAPVYVAPGYLEISGPSPMLVFRASGGMNPRRVPPSEAAQKPAAAAPTVQPAALPATEPASLPAPGPASLPAPNPLPAAPAPGAVGPDAEPGILPESDPRSSSARGHTEELLSYFQRQHAVARPYSASPVSPGEGGPNDQSSEPSFLQVPQAPEQPVLPPSSATYHVVP